MKIMSLLDVCSDGIVSQIFGRNPRLSDFVVTNSFRFRLNYSNWSNSPISSKSCDRLNLMCGFRISPFHVTGDGLESS